MAYMRKAHFSFLLLTVLLGMGDLAMGGPDDLALQAAAMQPRLETGVKYMFDGYYDKAIALFQQLEKEFPESPLGPLRTAETIWWKIFKAEGNFDKLHEMDVLKSKKPPFESEFHAAADKAIRLAEAMVKKYKDQALAYFYLGVANGLKSQLEGGKDNIVASAKFAKKMKQNLDKCLSLDPQLVDAYLELGLYNYQIDSLPPLFRTLKFTLGLPGGDKKKGLALIQQVKERGGHLGTEAKFYLASIYMSPEQKKYGEAAALIRDLHKEYPNNPTFHLLLGYIYEKMGQRDQARAVHNEILQRVQHKHENYDESVARQVSAP